MKKENFTIEWNNKVCGWECTDIIDNQLVMRIYVDFDKQDAILAFSKFLDTFREVKEIK